MINMADNFTHVVGIHENSSHTWHNFAKSHLIDWISVTAMGLFLFTLILGHLSDKEWCPTTFCFVGINAAMILYSFVPFKCKIIWRLYIRVHIRWCYIELILIHVCTETVNVSRNSKILTVFLLPTATKLGQGNKFTGVCLSTGGGGRGTLPCPGGEGGVLSEIFLGGVWSEIFGGGCLVWNFRGGGVWIFFPFFSFFFQFLFPLKKILLGYTPPPPRRSMLGRYASYWNAFLFYIEMHFKCIRTWNHY